MLTPILNGIVNHGDLPAMSDNTKFKTEDLSQPKTAFEYLRLYFSGFAMGSADIVPGVSGGTMAFILGIYETLINAIKSADMDVIRMALKFDVKGVIDHIPFRFIITLGLGIASAVLSNWWTMPSTGSGSRIAQQGNEIYSVIYPRIFIDQLYCFD